MAEPALSLRDLEKRYGETHAVAGIDLDVADGEFVTLLGPSGCGKTTTLGLIAGFFAPSAGDIRIKGRSIAGLPPYRRDIGVVFQDYALFPHMTAAQNVGFGLKMRSVPKAERERRVAEALDMVRLGALGARRPQEMSGGQRQRVALARALVIRPTILLLDEPLSNLDLKLREEMRVEIAELQRRLAITTVFVTHDQGEALVMSDRIAVMNAGRIEQLGTPVEIYERPAGRFVAEFIGRMNLFAGRSENGRVRLDHGTAPPWSRHRPGLWPPAGLHIGRSAGARPRIALSSHEPEARRPAMFRPNQMKRKLLAGQNVLGCWTTFGSPQIAELLALTGFDFLLFDQEHGLGDPTSLAALLQAFAPTQTSSVVRIPSNDPVYLKRVLDVGVEGVMIPQVETAAGAKAAVDACRYPPRGRRGSSIGSCRASNYGIAAAAYRKTADDEVLVIAQIESVRAVDNIAEIAAVDGIDVLFIGPHDLSGTLGHLGDLKQPDVTAAIARAEQAIAKSGKPMGTVPHPGVSWRDTFKRGYRMINAGSDVSRLRDAALADVKTFREAT